MVRLVEWPEALLWAVHSDTGRFAVGETVRLDWAGAWPQARILDKDGRVLILELLKPEDRGARRGRDAATLALGSDDADAERGEPVMAALGQANGPRVR